MKKIEKEVLKFIKSKFWISFLILFLLFSVISYATDKAVDLWNKLEKVSNEEKVRLWKEDINLMLRKLPKSHKNLYHAISKKEFIEMTKNLIDNLENMTNLEIYFSLKEISAKVGEGHTFAFHPIERNFKRFPFEFGLFDDGIYLITTDLKHKDLLGRKLLKINGFEVEEVLKRIYNYISADNMVQIKKKAIRLLSIYEYLKIAKIIKSDITEFEFKKDNETYKVKVWALDTSELKKLQFITVFDIKGNKKPIYLKRANEFYWYYFDRKNSILYFQYNICKNDPKNPLNKLFEQMKEIIKKEKPEKILIDLRRNSGGNSALLYKFIKFLSKTRYSKEKRIYVAIGSMTFSSAIINTIQLRKKANAILIGKPTGGKPNHYGEIKYFTLSNTGTYIFYSTKYFKLVKGDPPYILPDVEIKYYFKDFINGIDPIYEYLK